MATIDKDYTIIVPLHKRPDLIQDCCKLLNSEWPRSVSARYIGVTFFCQRNSLLKSNRSFYVKQIEVSERIVR